MFGTHTGHDENRSRAYAIGEGFERIDDMVGEWAETIAENIGNRDDVYGPDFCDVRRVRTESYDGFIPYTSGGYHAKIPASLRYAQASGDIPDVIRPYISDALKAAREQWDQDNPEWPVARLDHADGDPVADVMRERFSEMEDEHLDAEYYYIVRAIYHDDKSGNPSESGEPEVTFLIGINTDFGYGRDSIPWLTCYGGNPQQTGWIYERTIPAKKLTKKMMKVITHNALQALDRV